MDSTNRRIHSNTISGERPTEITIVTEPSSPRRNSEGACHLPLDSAPVTPLTSESLGLLSLQDHFPGPQRQETPSPANTPVAVAEKPVAAIPNTGLTAPPTTATTNTVATAKSSTLATLPLPADPFKEEEDRPLPPVSKTRSRGPSQSTVDPYEDAVSLSNSPPRIDEFNANSRMTAGSVASTCGVDLANSKRNADFHALFRSVPEQDMLIEDYGCALQKEILLQGRMYISENHVCFNANIFGWVTNLVIAVSDIVEIEKRSTAIIIPNAIQISTLHAKHSFASFLSRDQAYDLLVDVWRCVRPPQQPIEDQKVSESDDEDSDSSESSFSTSLSSDSSGELSSDDDTSSEEKSLPTQLSISSTSTLPVLKQKASEDASRKRAQSEAGPRPVSSPAEKTAQVQDKTECECGRTNSHYPTIVMDQTFDCPMEKIFQLLYEGDFIKTFLADVQKTTDIQITEWRSGEGDVESVREISYVKPLNGAIGPKSTRCFLSEEIIHKDFAEYVTQITTTQTPDVPSGGAFSVKTRTCLTWAGKGKTRVFVSVLVDFTKSSWLKSTIEKACIDGQMTYYKDLDATLRRYTEKQKISGLSKADRHKRKMKKEKRRLKKTTKSVQEPQLGWKDKAIRYIKQMSGPSTTQLIVLGMCIMMLINFYIASKIATVEKRLHQYSHGIQSKSKSVKKPMPNDQGETVWAWLGKLDYDVPETNDFPSEESIEKRLQTSREVKNRLDAHMDTLGVMLQRAEENMEQVSRAVEEQKEKMKNK